VVYRVDGMTDRAAMMQTCLAPRLSIFDFENNRMTKKEQEISLKAALRRRVE
jgi:hypothetical protein